ncbi:hypothetical protein GCM10009122_34990 [Fulvivirga kasyanovii]|uniref:Uncharacterized protein n=1 Tax=Fulvivirga kasyanovii TaxID=396812 RepID=A0ABW9RJL8_9BACT|nr:hypothetical protein [Fulvivirga kasyanovii]MTI24208.1 hypothetical protein [Fulvivirga kasyanovii]
MMNIISLIVHFLKEHKKALIAMILVGAAITIYGLDTQLKISQERYINQQKENDLKERQNLFEKKQLKARILDSIKTAANREERLSIKTEREQLEKAQYVLAAEKQKVGRERQKLEAQKYVNALVAEISNMGEARSNGVYLIYNKEYRILQSKLDQLEIQSRIAGQYELWKPFIDARRPKVKPSLIVSEG